MTNGAFAGLTGIEVYLFGSALSTRVPNDLDILLVYDQGMVTVRAALHIRKDLRRQVEYQAQLVADVCVLSRSELLSSRFVEQERAVKIYLK